MPKTTGIRPTPPKVEKLITELTGHNAQGKYIGEAGEGHDMETPPTRESRRKVLEKYVTVNYGLQKLLKGQEFESCHKDGWFTKTCYARDPTEPELNAAMKQHLAERSVEDGGSEGGRIPSAKRDAYFDQMAVELIDDPEKEWWDFGSS